MQLPDKFEMDNLAKHFKIEIKKESIKWFDVINSNLDKLKEGLSDDISEPLVISYIIKFFEGEGFSKDDSKTIATHFFLGLKNVEFVGESKVSPIVCAKKDCWNVIDKDKDSDFCINHSIQMMEGYSSNMLQKRSELRKNLSRTKKPSNVLFEDLLPKDNKWFCIKVMGDLFNNGQLYKSVIIRKLLMHSGLRSGWKIEREDSRAIRIWNKGESDGSHVYRFVVQPDK